VWWRRFLSPRPRKGRPRVPDGVHVYAVGDVHGRADLLNQTLARIDADLSVHPTARSIQIFIGDYIDRGPDSRQVLDVLIARQRSHSVVCLKGNHETFPLEFLNDPAVLADWKYLGGLETLLSYGVQPSLTMTEGDQKRLGESFRRALPETHLAFLTSLKPSYICGDFFFAHAGVRPAIPLERQQERDLLWIREDFLIHEGDFGKIVVHGHTPVVQPDIRPNRVNIDTGAYATGRLTCLKLEGDRMAFI